MDLIGISINHRTAPVELREALHLNQDEIEKIVPVLKDSVLAEGFVLSTCNRTEIFGLPREELVTIDDIVSSLQSIKKNGNFNNNNFDGFFSCGSVKHLFSVASGIDSMIVGDSQILGQVKEAFEISKSLDFVGPVLKRLFDHTLKVGKRAIKETSIGEGAVTVSYAAVNVIEKIFANLDKKSALVIGAGETGELAAVHLRDKGIGEISIANRTLAKAEKLAKKIKGGIIPFESICDNLQFFDIVISATSANDYILNYDDVKIMMTKRRNTPVCLMDIAVPRDIDPKVNNLENVFYNDIDSLQIIVKQNLKKREKEIPVVNNIIIEEMVHFYGWYNSLEMVPTILSIRDFFENIRQDELRKIKNKVTDEDYLKVEDMTRRMLGRILHNPTKKLKEIAETGESGSEVQTRAMCAKELFGLSNSNGNHYITENNNGEQV